MSKRSLYFIIEGICLFISEKRCNFAHCYGIKLDLDRIFYHCFRNSRDKTGVLGRLRRFSRHDGFNILVVKNRLRDFVGLNWRSVSLARNNEDR